MFNSSAVRFFWNILKGWLIHMLKQVFMSLLGCVGFSGGTFGDTCCVNFGWCVNSGKVVTIKEALLSGKIVQDDWTEFALRMIQKGVEDGWLKSGSGEYEKLLSDVIAYSMFNDEKKKD